MHLLQGPRDPLRELVTLPDGLMKGTPSLFSTPLIPLAPQHAALVLVIISWQSLWTFQTRSAAFSEKADHTAFV